MTKSHLSLGVVPVAGGSRQWECTVLENFAWLLALKMAQNCYSRTNPHITGNLPGCWLRKKCENCHSQPNRRVTGKKKQFLGNIINILYQNNAF